MGSTAAASKGVRVSADVIIHATEDAQKILAPLGVLLGLGREGGGADGFAIDRAAGCFENPIEVARAEIAGERAADFVRGLVGKLPRRQLDGLIDEIPERVSDSRLHLRLDKQALVGGRVVMAGGAPYSGEGGGGEGGYVRITIRARTYNRRDAVQSFAEILRGARP